MAAPTFTITQHTTAPALELTLQDAAGVVNLTTASGVVFNMRAAADGTIKITDLAGTIVNAAQGLVRFDLPDSGGTDVVGTYYGKVTVTWSGGKTTAFPTDEVAANNYLIVKVVDDAKVLN